MKKKMKVGILLLKNLIALSSHKSKLDKSLLKPNSFSEKGSKFYIISSIETEMSP